MTESNHRWPSPPIQASIQFSRTCTASHYALSILLWYNSKAKENNRYFLQVGPLTAPEV